MGENIKGATLDNVTCDVSHGWIEYTKNRFGRVVHKDRLIDDLMLTVFELEDALENRDMIQSVAHLTRPRIDEDWPALVTFSDNQASNHTQRSQYRRGKLPSVRSLIKWAKAHGLRFVVDADGLRCERVSPPGRA